MFDVALPERTHRRQHLAQVVAAFPLLHAAGHPVELVLKGAPAKTQFQAAVAEQIEQRCLSGEPDRVPIGRDHHRGAETDTRGMRRPVHQDGEWIGADGQLDRVMLRRPGDLEPAGFSELHQVEGIADHLAHILCPGRSVPG